MKRSDFPTDRPVAGDSKPMVDAIATLLGVGFKFDRQTKYHLKVDDWNFWPSTGTIVRDDAASREGQRGLDAFVSILRTEREAAEKSIQRNRRPHLTVI